MVADDPFANAPAQSSALAMASILFVCTGNTCRSVLSQYAGWQPGGQQGREAEGHSDRWALERAGTKVDGFVGEQANPES